MELAEGEIRELKSELASSSLEFDSLIGIAEQERDQALSSSGEIKEQAIHLKARVASLESAMQKGKIEPSTPIPNDLSDLKGWAERHLSGSVILHNRAIRDAKKSRYDDHELVYNSLILLKKHYVPMRKFGGADNRKRYEQECKLLQLVDDQCFPGNRAHEQGDEYFIKYSGKKRQLDRHLKKGNSKDERYCFRLYFFWDEEDQQVIVGSLPAHLKTRV